MDSSQKNTLELIGSQIESLDPISVTSSPTIKVLSQIHGGLYNYHNGNPEPEKHLVEDVEIMDGGKRYQYTLRQDATFNDGTAVTASDVEYSFMRLVESPHSAWKETVLSEMGVEHETILEDTEEVYEKGSLKVSAVDEYTVELQLKQPNHLIKYFLAHPSFSIVPEGIVGDINGYDGQMTYESFSTENPIGTGPFKVDRWLKGTEYQVTARDNYRGEGPHIDSIHWSVQPGTSSRYAYAMNKNADLFWIPGSKYNPSKIEITSTDKKDRKTGTYSPLQNGETAQYLQIPLYMTYYFGFNTDVVEKPVRKAIAYTLNQKQQLTEIHQDRGDVATRVTPPGLFPTEEGSIYPYGVEESKITEAREVMEAAGYHEQNQRGVTLTVYDAETWGDSAKLLRDKLKTAHINLEIEQAPFSTLMNRGENGSLEMFSYAWTMDYPDAQSFVKLLDPRDRQKQRYTKWSGSGAANRAAKAWNQIEQNQGHSEEETQKRQEAYQDIERANWEDVVILPKYHPIGESFSYKNIEVPKAGSAGFDMQKYNTLRMNQ